jgi:hypothetical protein
LHRIGDPILKTGIWGNYYIEPVVK